MIRRNWLQRLVLNHFWGKVEGVFYTSIAVYIFSLLMTTGSFKDWADTFKVAYDTYKMASDIVGKVGLIVAIPSGITYAVGYFRGKYPRKPPKGYA